MEILETDDLARLWREEPDKAEAYHRAIIEDFILGLPEDKQERARGLQWRIDQELRKLKDPIARMNRMCELMWESFFELDDAWQGKLPKTKPKAKVLDFPTPGTI
jgi:hypothetical protein